MKKNALLTPFIVVALLLAAHFLRLGYLPLVAICLGFPFILLHKKPVSLFLSRAFIVVATIEWGKTTAQIIVERMATETDWTRLGVIMAIVIGFNIFALIILCLSRTLKEIYLKG